MRISSFCLFLLAGALLAACGNYDYRKTESGIIYKIHKGSESKATIQPGEYVKLHFRVQLGDSVLANTFDRVPAYGMYDTTMRNVHDFVDFLGEMRVGDSADFVRSIDSMQKRGFLMYNDRFKKGGSLKGFIKILGTYSTQDSMNLDQEKEFVKEKDREVLAIEKLLAEKKMTGYTKTPSGVFVKIEQEGPGPGADSGKVVAVNYTGRLQDGTLFDSNTDPTQPQKPPFEFMVGTGSVIKGWDEAIPLFKKGSKGKVIIPAMLGYGSQANGEKLPAYSDLWFDIEVTEVKEAPAPGNR
jgi:FKBP-type peptidyl-prolyl cis-trans isomerase